MNTIKLIHTVWIFFVLGLLLAVDVYAASSEELANGQNHESTGANENKKSEIIYHMGLSCN